MANQWMVVAVRSESDTWPVACFTRKHDAVAAAALYYAEQGKNRDAEYKVEEIDLDPPLRPTGRLLGWVRRQSLATHDATGDDS